MHQLETLLDDNAVRCHLPAASRKRALQMLAEILSDEETSVDTLFDGLMGRERLGSTGLGDGVAIGGTFWMGCTVGGGSVRISILCCLAILPEYLFQ